MEIRKVTLDITLKTDKPVNLGVWQGAKIRSALISAIARMYCDSLRYGQCDNCRIETCMNKYLFYFKQDRSARMASNPIIIDTMFNEDMIISNEISFKIHVFEPAIDYIEDIIEVLERGVYLGSPSVRFKADNGSINQTEYSFNLADLDEVDDSKSDTIIEINIDTPMLTNSLSGVTPQQIIKNCTTRITSMVNTVGLDYTVQHEIVNEAAKSIKLVKADLKIAENGKMSTRKNKYSKMVGYTGKLVISGDFRNIYPYLKLASNLNIGKQCSMGFGRISIGEDKHDGE